MPDHIRRLDNGSIEIDIKVPWTDINREFEKHIVKAVAEAELPGFRKGKAPRNLVEPKLNKEDLYNHSLEELLPGLYTASVKEHALKPILYPRIKLVKGNIGEDWEFVATTCEAPEFTLPGYKNDIPRLKFENKDQKLATILQYLTKNTSVKIPGMLVEEEVNHRLAALTDNITKLGLTTQNYLNAKKATPETLKATLTVEAQADLALEFILDKIADLEKLKERKQVLDFLASLV